jgi:hypothetical protein
MKTGAMTSMHYLSGRAVNQECPAQWRVLYYGARPGAMGSLVVPYISPVGKYPAGLPPIRRRLSLYNRDRAGLCYRHRDGIEDNGTLLVAPLDNFPMPDERCPAWNPFVVIANNLRPVNFI